MFIHTTCVHKFIHTTSPSKHVHKSTKCLESNETSSEHDQLSPRAYGKCSCGGKGGMGDRRTCSPLGACWFEPAEKDCTKETRLQVLDMIRQENQKLFGIILTEVPRTCCVGNTCGGGVIGAGSPGGRVIPPDVARYLVSSSNLLSIACRNTPTAEPAPVLAGLLAAVVEPAPLLARPTTFDLSVSVMQI
jgi:hypothetical protein